MIHAPRTSPATSAIPFARRAALPPLAFCHAPLVLTILNLRTRLVAPLVAAEGFVIPDIRQIPTGLHFNVLFGIVQADVVLSLLRYLPSLLQ